MFNVFASLNWNARKNACMMHKLLPRMHFPAPYWLTWLSVSFVIGWGDYFGLVLRHSIKNCSTDFYTYMFIYVLRIWFFIQTALKILIVSSHLSAWHCVDMVLQCSVQFTHASFFDFISRSGSKTVAQDGENMRSKTSRSSPLCFKHAAKQQWRDLTAGHVPAAFCHFPAAQPNESQTMEPSLPSVSCKHCYFPTQWYV